MTRILITGGSGFLGSHITEYLASVGYDVIVYDLKMYSFNVNRIQVVNGDVVDLAKLSSVMEKCDGVIHLAGISRSSDGNHNPLNCISSNVLGTTTVLEAARLSSVSWVILGSSRIVADDCQNDSMDNSIYGVSKWCAEKIAQSYVGICELKVMVLRFGDIYGSARDSNKKVLMTLMTQALENNPMNIKNAKSQFDFVHVKDVVKSIQKSILYIELMKNGSLETLPIGTGKATTLIELAELIVTICSSQSPINVIMENMPKENFMLPNIEKARERLHFTAKTELKDGLNNLRDELSESKYRKSVND